MTWTAEDELWGLDHVCDSLCEFHVALIDVEIGIYAKIENMAAAAVKRLDAMVEAGEKRQRVAHLRYLLATHRGIVTGVYFTDFERQWRAYRDWKRSGKLGAFPGQSIHGHRTIILKEEL